MEVADQSDALTCTWIKTDYMNTDDYFFIFRDSCYTSILLTAYQMAPSRRPRQSQGVAATPRILSLDDDELDENRSTNENATRVQSVVIAENSIRVQSEVIAENSNSNDNNVSAPEDNENIRMNTNDEKQLRSNVWKYAKKISKETAQCIKCKLSIKTPAGGTTTLRKHLIKKHNLTHLILYANPRTKIDSSISREQKNRLDNLAYLAIFEDGRAFGDLRKNGITKFLAEAIPDNLNEDDDEQNRDEIMDTWGNDVVTGDVRNMDIDESDDDEESTLLTIEKLANTIQKSRSLIKLIRRSQILMMYVNDEKKLSGINRRLIIDCITRWNSTYLAVQSLLIHKNVLLNLYQSKRKLVLTSKQKEKLNLCELSNDEYDIISNLMDIFDSFYQATNLLSGSKYPTIGLCLYILRQIKDFLEDENEDL
ncbi:unnamed protein product [Rotaria socialis]|uniref:BED-type domain-containing protein n=1 Tax=Rotaria socialis TaxID=392032 RepID=A0A818NST0_9BILA|nr:unnamed protein product [Rotaria socialis]CAF3609563.1 unnamed protein product [Rotaria socialis]CAF4837599.1 unnamed protein product [Rotaria socialis]